MCLLLPDPSPKTCQSRPCLSVKPRRLLCASLGESAAPLESSDDSAGLEGRQWKANVIADPSCVSSPFNFCFVCFVFKRDLDIFFCFKYFRCFLRCFRPNRIAFPDTFHLALRGQRNHLKALKNFKFAENFNLSLLSRLAGQIWPSI